MHFDVFSPLSSSPLPSKTVHRDSSFHTFICFSLLLRSAMHFPSMAFLTIFLFVISYLPLLSLAFQSNQNQFHFFALFKQSFSMNSASLLNAFNKENFSLCNYAGFICNEHGDVVEINLSGRSLSGLFPANICSYLPELRVLRLDRNVLQGGFPPDLVNCSNLEILNLSSAKLHGEIPDLSSMKSLRVLDLSYNFFSGKFPLSITNLSMLEVMNFNENGFFDTWKLPEEIFLMKNLKQMILSTCSISGQIPASISNLTALTDLELSGNFLVGRIPSEIGKMRNLRFLELYYNQLSGELPIELGNLTALTDLDISVNKLTGNIPETLCQLPNLRVLQLYNNSLSGEIPKVIGNSTSLSLLSLYENFFTGVLPENIGSSSDFNMLDVSENQFHGQLPGNICNRGQLVYFLVLNNQFSGKLPESYAKCRSLVRFRVSNNRLEGLIPEGLLGLPHASIIDLGFNRFEGSIPKTIKNGKNLSSLMLQNNQLSGVIPSEINGAINLMKLDLSSNLLSGAIPSEIGELRRLNLLFLQENKLNSSIPSSLSSLKLINVLNVSNNLLTGTIPESLCKLLPSSLDFSNNRLAGPVPIALIEGGLAESFSGNPDLCMMNSVNTTQSLHFCRDGNRRKKTNNMWVIGASSPLAVIGFLLFLKQWFRNKGSVGDQEIFSPSSSYDVKNYYKLSFDQKEIVEALIDKNIIGHGGSGTVYKIELGNDMRIAVKKLWTRKTKDPSPEQLFLDKEIKTEVETLGTIRHKNIVKLYCYFSNSDMNLLVYEYMPNGNLWDSLHKGSNFLDWPTRHQIALGIAQGLAYLHHDLLPPIIHRDIKSTNILLNKDFQAKVADFGIAKVLQGREKDCTTTLIAGTYGYLAPEYAYSCKATTKCDVYSFGVVLMELITGRKPIETEFGEHKNIIFWISCKMTTKESAMEVLDKRLSNIFKEEMFEVLRIALRCTCRSPSHRPTMKEVVQQLIQADTCRFRSCPPLNKLKE